MRQTGARGPTKGDKLEIFKLNTHIKFLQKMLQLYGKKPLSSLKNKNYKFKNTSKIQKNALKFTQNCIFSSMHAKIFHRSSKWCYRTINV